MTTYEINWPFLSKLLGKQSRTRRESGRHYCMKMMPRVAKYLAVSARCGCTRMNDYEEETRILCLHYLHRIHSRTRRASLRHTNWKHPPDRICITCGNYKRVCVDLIGGFKKGRNRAEESHQYFGGIISYFSDSVVLQDMPLNRPLPADPPLIGGGTSG